MNGIVSKKVQFISKGELIGFIVVIIMVLYILFPQDRLMKYSEVNEYEKLYKENTHLSIKFLEEVTHKNPEYIGLKVLLIYKYIEIGEFSKAREKIKDLEDSKVADNDTLLLLQFELLKKETFSYPETSIERKKFLEKLRDFIKMSYPRIKKPEILRYLYKQSISLNIPYTAFEIAVRLSELDQKNETHWLKVAGKIAYELGLYNKALTIYEKLYKIEKNPKWLNKEIEILIMRKEFSKAMRLIDRYVNSKINKAYKLKLLAKGAEIALWNREYIKSSEYYIKALEISENTQIKKKFFKKAIEVLRAGDKSSQLERVIKKYKNEFISDKEIAKFMIKVALEIGNVELARELSLKLMDVKK